MAYQLVSDELWNQIEPLLPRERPKPKGGRPRVADRACLTGIVFVLRTGSPWRYVPNELGCGSGVTCWRRLDEWTRGGVWPRVHTRLLRALANEGDFRLSCHLIEMAVLAEPADKAVHAARAEIYAERRNAETSLMAKGIYGHAARESEENL